VVLFEQLTSDIWSKSLWSVFSRQNQFLSLEPAAGFSVRPSTLWRGLSNREREEIAEALVAWKAADKALASWIW